MNLLDARTGFDIAALVVTWGCIVLLALMVAGLWARLRQVEALLPVAADHTAFGGLIGQPLGGAVEVPAGVRLVVLLEANCRSCRRILDALAEPSWVLPTAVAWRGAAPEPPVPLSSTVRVLAGGDRLAAALAVGVTPFALALDNSGRIAAAAPVADAEVLARLAGAAGRFRREAAA